MSASGGTTDINRIKQSAEFQELVDRLWERWRGKKVTRDSRGRPNRRSFANFLANVILAAYRARVPDPYKDIDWEHVIDPDLSPSENYGLLEQQLGLRFEERPPIPGETDEDTLRSQIESTELQIRELDFMIRHGQDERGNRLTPEQIEALRKEKEDLEKYLEALRRQLEEVEAKKPLPTPERGRGAPRRRARPAEERAPAPAPPPTPPPTAPAVPTPEEERERLWEAFSIALAAAGLDPTEFREDFEGAYRAVANRPYAEKFNAVMRMASEIIRERMPRVPVALRETLESLREELRKGLEDIAQSLNRPVTPQEYRAAVEAELASVPPEESIEMLPVEAVGLTAQECGGHTHIWAPNDEALGEMRGYGVNEGIIEKFYTCPEMWWNEADGNADLEFTVAVMEDAREVPPFFARWLMRLAKAIDDKYEREGRMKGILRLKEYRKRYKGPLTAVGRR